MKKNGRATLLQQQTYLKVLTGPSLQIIIIYFLAGLMDVNVYCIVNSILGW